MGHIRRISVDSESERKDNKHRKEKNKKRKYTHNRQTLTQPSTQSMDLEENIIYQRTKIVNISASKIKIYAVLKERNC